MAGGCSEIAGHVSHRRGQAGRSRANPGAGDGVHGARVSWDIGEQLDLLYKDIVAGKLDTTGEWAKKIKAVKDANAKE